MKMNKLDKSVLKLWLIRAGIGAVSLVGSWVGLWVMLAVAGAPADVKLVVLLGGGVLAAIALCLVFVMPVLRHKLYEWGYDEKRIVVKQGVIFRQRVVIPICQIQDLHRTQGPLMLLMKLSGVTISTAGSNFSISTLTAAEADRLIDDLEVRLEARVEELNNETV